MPIGSRIPIDCTGSGRAFLSALPQDDALRLLQSAPRVAHTMHTRIDETELLDRLSDERRCGYNINKEEMFLGDMTLAAPISKGAGQHAAAVHIVETTTRWSLQHSREKLAHIMLEGARSVNKSIRARE